VLNQVKIFTVRIELVDALNEDYAILRRELEQRSFSQTVAEKEARTVQYSFAGEMDVDSVAKLAHRSAIKTGRRFFIFVSDSNTGKGLGIAG
jgi:hypothetical protein